MHAEDALTDGSTPTPDTPSPGDPAATDPVMPVDPMAGLTLRFDEDSLDEDGYTSLWNVAATTTGGDTELSRMLAAKMLGFLCKHQVDFVFVSSTDAKYLDEWFERDHSLLYDWTPQSEKVDVLSQHAQVPAKAVLSILKQKKFDPTKNYSPRRADRVEWFSNVWCIG